MIPTDSNNLGVYSPSFFYLKLQKTHQSETDVVVSSSTYLHRIYDPRSTPTGLKHLFHSYDRVNCILPNGFHDNLAELSRKIIHIFENINEYLHSMGFR